MKVELQSQTDATGKTKYWVYIDSMPKECFSSFDDAKEYYNSIDGSKASVQVLETKEV